MARTRVRKTRTIDPVTMEPIVVNETEQTIDLRDDLAGVTGGSTRAIPAPPPETMVQSPVPPIESPALLSERPPPQTRIIRERVPMPVSARGSVSLWSMLSGTLCTLGLLMVAGVAAAIFAVNTASTSTTTAIDIGITGSLIAAAVMLIACYWGGYTAGRMARNAGWLHGLMVAVLTAGAFVGLGLWARAAGATPFTVPFQNGRFQIDHTTLSSVGIPMAILIGAAMGVGGLIGGMMGMRWHARLEHRKAAEEFARAVRDAP